MPSSLSLDANIIIAIESNTIIIGIIGFILCGINYPIYKRMLERDKAKYAYEIVELAREISEEK